MKFSLFLIFFSVSALAAGRRCEDVPFGTGANASRRVQTAEALTGVNDRRPQDSAFGSDLVYEGAPCPDNKVCVEFLSPGGYTDIVHGQAVIIDKNTGNVEALRPLELGTNRRRAGQGFPFFDRARFLRVCEGVRQAKLFQYRASDPTATVTSVDDYCKNINLQQEHTLDIYSHRRDSSESFCDTRFLTAPFYQNDYCAYSPESRARAIEVLNAGVVTRPGESAQAPSVQAGGAGTFRALAKVVGNVRRRLRCDPLPEDLRTRLAFSLVDQANDFGTCLRVSRGQNTPDRFTRRATNNDALTTFSVGDQYARFTEDVARAEAPRVRIRGNREEKARAREIQQYEAGQTVRGNAAFSIPPNCVSVQNNPSIETVTCDNGELPPVDPAATRTARYASRPQEKVVFRIVNGRIENVDVERNYTYLTDLKVTCAAAPETRGVTPSTNSGGTKVDSQ